MLLLKQLQIRKRLRKPTGGGATPVFCNRTLLSRCDVYMCASDALLAVPLDVCYAWLHHVLRSEPAASRSRAAQSRIHVICYNLLIVLLLKELRPSECLGAELPPLVQVCSRYLIICGLRAYDFIAALVVSTHLHVLIIAGFYPGSRWGKKFGVGRFQEVLKI